MFNTTFLNAYGLVLEQRPEVKPSPAGLRAAAKILTDKADELEQPKWTKEQEAVIAWAEDRGIDAYKKGLDGKDYFIYRDLTIDEDSTDFVDVDSFARVVRADGVYSIMYTKVSVVEGSCGDYQLIVRV